MSRPGNHQHRDFGSVLVKGGRVWLGFLIKFWFWRHKTDKEEFWGLFHTESTGKTLVAFSQNTTGGLFNKQNEQLVEDSWRKKPDKISNYLHHKQQHRGVINNDGEITMNLWWALLGSALLQLWVWFKSRLGNEILIRISILFPKYKTFWKHLIFEINVQDKCLQSVQNLDEDSGLAEVVWDVSLPFPLKLHFSEILQACPLLPFFPPKSIYKFIC